MNGFWEASDELKARIRSARDTVPDGVRERDATMVARFLESLSEWEECSAADHRRGMVSVSTFGARARYDAWRETVALVAADYGVDWPQETRTGVIA